MRKKMFATDNIEVSHFLKGGFMKRFKTEKVYLIFMFIMSLLVILPGCGGEGAVGGGKWDNPDFPTVSSTTPANNATGVPILSVFTVLFSEAMDPATITAATFTVNQGATVIPGTVTYSGVTAVFSPTNSPLAPNATFTCTITKDAKNLAGRSLPGEYTWSFTTGAIPDTTPPTITFTSPAHGSLAVDTNRKVSVIFSEPVEPTSVSTTSYNVKETVSGASVPGTAVSVGTSATFTPTSPLALSRGYTATITTGVKDLAGNAMAGNYLFSFTTGTVADTVAPTVSVTSPTNSAIDVPTNRIVNVGFSESMDPLTISTASFKMKESVSGNNVPGAVTAVGTSASFAPANSLTFSTGYTVTVSTGVSDLAGNTLANNFVFSFTTGADTDKIPPVVTFTSPANISTNVALNRKINVAFSESIDPLTITTGTFVVTGPISVGKATSKNVSLATIPIAGTVTTSGSTITYIPSTPLAASSVYTATITNGVRDLAGNPLAKDFIFSFTTTPLPDTTPPTVSVTSPANSDIDVRINRKITVGFSEEMDPSTITTVSFKLNGPGGASIPGTVSYIGTVATFIPLNNLSNSSLYTTTVTTGVKDLAENPLATNLVFTFTTGAAADTTPPTVSVTSPTNTAIDVPLNRKVTVGFSEDMDPLSITAASFTMIETVSKTNVAGTVSCIGTTATLVPLLPLAYNTSYSGTVTTGVKDLAGNPMASTFVFTFTTGASPDAIAPTVSLTSPANGAIDVPINRKITIGFSEVTDPLSITTTTFTMTGPGATPVTGTVVPAGTSASFTPTVTLKNSTIYTVTITTGVKDLAGNPMVSNFVSTFTTGATPDTTPPTVISTYP